MKHFLQIVSGKRMWCIAAVVVCMTLFSLNNVYADDLGTNGGGTVKAPATTSSEKGTATEGEVSNKTKDPVDLSEKKVKPDSMPKLPEGAVGEGDSFVDKHANVETPTDTAIPPLISCAESGLPGCDAKSGIGESAAVQKLAPSIIKTLLIFAAAMALIFLIYAGWQYVIAFGDEGAYTQAKKSIIWAIIGLILTIISYALVDIIASVEWTTPPAVESSKDKDASKTDTPTTPAADQNKKDTTTPTKTGGAS